MPTCTTPVRKKRGRVQPLERRVPFRFFAIVSFKQFFIAGHHVSQPRLDPTVSGRVWLVDYLSLAAWKRWSVCLYSRLAILVECAPRRRVVPMPHAMLPSMLLLCFRASFCA